MQGDFPPAVFELLQKQMASMGRVGATRFFITTPLATSPVAAGGTSTPTNVRFTERGIVLAMMGQEQGGTPAAYAQTGVRCQIGGAEDLFVDGNGGPAFPGMLGLFGGVTNWLPLMRRAIPGTDWTFTFQNNTAEGTIVPQITLAFISDADVARMQANQVPNGQ